MFGSKHGEQQVPFESAKEGHGDVAMKKKIKRFWFIIVPLFFIIIFVLAICAITADIAYQIKEAPYRYDVSAENAAKQADKVNQMIDRGAYGDQMIQRAEYMRSVNCDYLVFGTIPVNCRVDSVHMAIDNIEYGLQPVKPVWQDYGSNGSVVHTDTLRLPDSEFVTADWEPENDRHPSYEKLIGKYILQAHSDFKQPSAKERAIAKRKANEKMPKIDPSKQELNGIANGKDASMIHTEPKDSHANDKQQYDSTNFEDNAPSGLSFDD